MKILAKYFQILIVLYPFIGICQGESQLSLTTFDAKKEGKDNIVFWSSFTEINNNFYTIERSVDGINFDSINVVLGSENPTLQNDYSTIDLDYVSCINYYRLRQTNIDGAELYSNLVSVDNRVVVDKVVVKTINIMGVEVDRNYKGVVVYVFSDNSILKTIQ